MDKMEFNPLYIAIAILFATVTSAMTQLDGTLQSCPNEGARIPVDSIDEDQCFSCVCKNGFVWCSDGCPNTEGCHMLVDEGCCRRCKGCIFEGVHHPSDTEWENPLDPCTVMRCEGGVVTISELRCHTPCANPLPREPGKCCATCPECKMNDQIVTDDRDVTSDDPCLKCRCSGSRMICSKKACPVLQCSLMRQIHLPGECCPRCKGTRILITPKNTCALQTSFFREGDNFSIDKCSNCTCQNDTSICRRISCPILDCAPDLQKSVPGSCCKKCELPEEFRSTCSYAGKTYEDGQQWKLDACKSCICQRGMPSCAITRCNTTSNTCPYGTRLNIIPGECCPKCVEVEGACMVFGDPHYKTFDGRIYSFKGIGKYQLVADCVNHTFSIRVANAVNDGTSVATKRVAIRYLNTRLNLQQNLRMKYNGTIVTLPFKVDGRFRAEQKKDFVEITFNNGVKVFWNFKSFVEVRAPTSFKNKLCGLCGNYNNDVEDDLTTRAGRNVTEKEILGFAASWCLGRKSDCEKKIRPQNRSYKTTKKNGCKLFNSDIFSACHTKLNFSKYNKACKMDMEHCSRGNKCYCDSLMAYARECNRLDVVLHNWQKYTFCEHSSRRKQKKHHRSNRKGVGDLQKIKDEFGRRKGGRTVMSTSSRSNPFGLIQ